MQQELTRAFCEDRARRKPCAVEPHEAGEVTRHVFIGYRRCRLDSHERHIRFVDGLQLFTVATDPPWRGPAGSAERYLARQRGPVALLKLSVGRIATRVACCHSVAVTGIDYAS